MHAQQHTHTHTHTHTRAPAGDDEDGGDAMDEDGDTSQAVILHEDKKYFPDAEEVCMYTYKQCVCMYRGLYVYM